jgi:hypothetical protein
MSDDAWGRYEKLVIGKLDEHGKALGEIHREVIRLQVEMGVIKTKVGFIGAASGTAASLLIYFVKYVFILKG